MPPAYKSSITSQTFHANVFFHTDGKSVQRSLNFAVFSEKAIKIFGTFQSLLREELGDAIGLCRSDFSRGRKDVTHTAY